MRKILLLSLAMLLLAGQALAADLWPFDKTPWGMSRTDAAAMFKLQNPPQEGQLVLTGAHIENKGRQYPLLIGLNFPEGTLANLQIAVGMPGDAPMTAQGCDEIRAFLDGFFTQEYGKPARDKEACRQIPDCTVSEWNRDKDTLVRLVAVRGEKPSVSAYYFSASWLAAERKKQEAPVYAPALKGHDAAFEAGVRRRIEERYRETPVEPLADFEMDTTEAADGVYARYRLRKTPLSLAAAQKDAREVVIMMVKEMLDLGINPGTEKIFVSLRLYEAEKGVTGQDMARGYGRMRYNPLTDSVEWEPAKQ